MNVADLRLHLLGCKRHYSGLDRGQPVWVVSRIHNYPSPNAARTRTQAAANRSIELYGYPFQCHDCQCHVVHHVPVCALCPASAPGPCGLRVGGGHWCMWTLDCAWAAYLLTTLLDCPPLGLAASQLRHRHRPRKRSLAVGQTLGSTREDARMPYHILPLISPGVVPLRVSRPAAPSRARPCVFSGSRGTAAAPCGTRRSRPRTSSPSGS